MSGAGFPETRPFPAPSRASPRPPDRVASEFGVYWPPLDPEEVRPAGARPLLEGALTVDVGEPARRGSEIRLAVELTRPSGEDDRRAWNSALAFADLAWMREVRVWDAGRQWLWPNLPYLLRLPGRERVERYGGMDPGKGVDNDFAAVLIRAYDAEGAMESDATRDAPLVSAEWHAPGGSGGDRHAIVHTARSDEFLLHVGRGRRAERGRIKVWWVYADFLGARAPATWPQEPEWAGGILAYFEIDWASSPGGGCRVGARTMRPPESTGFDWAGWVVRAPGSDESTARVRVSDAAAPSLP